MSKNKNIKDTVPLNNPKGIVNDNLVNVMAKNAQRNRDVTNPGNNMFMDMPALSYSQLENIYMTTWIGKKIVDLPIDFMFKNGFEINIEGQEALEKEAMDFYKKNKMEQLWKNSIRYKKQYGGGIIFPKDRFQDPMQPYDFTAFKGRDIEFVARDLSYLAIVPYTNITAANYYEPMTIIMAGLSIDARNPILFRGIQVPKRRIPAFRYLGMSIYQNIFQAMISDEYVSKGIVNMVWRGNMKYYKLDGFDATVKQGGEDLALERLSLIEDNASITSAGVLDAKDDVTWVSQSFASLADIDHRSLTRLAAASNIPSMVLLGRAPESTGLGSDTNGEMENFYNYIENEQADEIDNGVALFQIICFILTGKKHQIELKFNKPNNINPKAQADCDKVVLENMTAMQQIGINDDIIIDYAVKNGLVTTEQATEIDELKSEMMQLSEQEQEVNKEKIDDSMSRLLKWIYNKITWNKNAK